MLVNIVATKNQGMSKYPKFCACVRLSLFCLMYGYNMPFHCSYLCKSLIHDFVFNR